LHWGSECGIHKPEQNHPMKAVRPSEMPAQEFVRQFGDLYEHSPWVAQRRFDAGLDQNMDDIEGLSSALATTLNGASRDEKLALIRAHPDLAGKAAARGELTDDSNLEQSSAGLDQCSEEELQRFHQLNDAYKEKFDFPFIMAVKDSNRHLILAAFETRLQNDRAVEFDTAIEEINKIAKLRLTTFFSK